MKNKSLFIRLSASEHELLAKRAERESTDMVKIKPTTLARYFILKCLGLKK